ncbi:Soluble NSF Attachment Protein (SNAP) Receptor (SNARE) [Ectocarpus siliculosus]|uniref:Soluble NSF Attachment Protein (SNAP) Receptor (SNARE) n=1 Tax=Ectocarpus siliculosus TaxID=2880 RepID=D7G5P2_ECTSI|nr:Soluble NSF Attachment Protein (SNAP) Receptor (SNARE) [Ectocarpus siliculosus]|eukprot:CBJ27339.1 Soluble NSF Attachment Protein (SNAP) Receptor (SNARE) [Ectocarpus siliculosus]
MNDRLGELTGGGGGGSSVAPFEIAIDINDNGDGGGGGGGGGAGFMEGFFDKVNAVKKDIDAVKKACTDLDTLTQQATLTSSATVEADAKSQINTTIANTNNRVAHAKGLLQAMREETEAMKKDPSRAKPSEVRVRENLQNTLTRKFVDLAKDYQNRQNKYKTSVKKKAERQILAVKPSATEEELTTVFEQEDGVQRVMEAAILQQGDPVEVTHVLEEVKDTYHDVRRLEASILELHKMFMDLALLVDRQGEMLDQIEYQVKSASDYVKDANTDIAHAIDSSKKIRKRQCCMIIIVLVIIAIIVLVIYVMGS